MEVIAIQDQTMACINVSRYKRWSVVYIYALASQIVNTSTLDLSDDLRSQLGILYNVIIYVYRPMHTVSMLY